MRDTKFPSLEGKFWDHPHKISPPYEEKNYFISAHTVRVVITYHHHTSDPISCQLIFYRCGSFHLPSLRPIGRHITAVKVLDEEHKDKMPTCK